MDKKCNVIIHDPYVKKDDQNLLKFKLEKYFTNDLSYSINKAEIIIICTAHKLYIDKREEIINTNKNLLWYS